MNPDPDAWLDAFDPAELDDPNHPPVEIQGLMWAWNDFAVARIAYVDSFSSDLGLHGLDPVHVGQRLVADLADLAAPGLGARRDHDVHGELEALLRRGRRERLFLRGGGGRRRGVLGFSAGQGEEGDQGETQETGARGVLHEDSFAHLFLVE